jgi:hypothetical protein
MREGIRGVGRSDNRAINYLTAFGKRIGYLRHSITYHIIFDGDTSDLSETLYDYLFLIDEVGTLMKIFLFI